MATSGDFFLATSGDFFLATSGDFFLATCGDFLMAMDTLSAPLLGTMSTASRLGVSQQDE